MRRANWRDYYDRGIYMVTLATEGRVPLLGSLSYDHGKPETATVKPTQWIFCGDNDSDKLQMGCNPARDWMCVGRYAAEALR
ncbi:MAG: hypothetical protein Q4B68_07245, partial [Bacteroidales bacterium]|nr:hypothetical protein [Bacteroidales bacterium]